MIHINEQKVSFNKISDNLNITPLSKNKKIIISKN